MSSVNILRVGSIVFCAGGKGRVVQISANGLKAKVEQPGVAAKWWEVAELG